MRTPDDRVLEGTGGLVPGPLTLCHGSLGVNRLPSLSRTEADFGSKWVGLGQERGCEGPPRVFPLPLRNRKGAVSLSQRSYRFSPGPDGEEGGQPQAEHGEVLQYQL